ncbi:putative repeat protein (TIGR02543 family) [Acidovorax soli]|uniref:Putative repeat protein (TIGR02543 family) n=1 Tax=Acidovorax soli TaxID=592050 RepID=A0A7X0PC54_9BURK|nr:putative repeat protein (TIGR02543 family) [Acidovorax soli]
MPSGADTFTWAGALSAAAAANAANHLGHNDWRLPSKNELESLVDVAASASPVIDPVFPWPYPGAEFWSSTTYTPAPSGAWRVSFANGSVAAEGKTTLLRVRLLRGGSAAAAFDRLHGALHAITSSVNPAAAGSVNCSPNPVVQGASAICTATPSAGYVFSGWGGDCSGTSATCTLSNVTAARSVTASFARNDPGPSGPSGPTETPVQGPGVVNVTDPSLPVVVGPGGDGATIVLPGTGTTPVSLQITVNGQPMTVTALPGTQLKVTRVDGQDVLVLVVLQGEASMASTAAGQPMALAGTVLLSAGAAGTRIDAQPLTVAVVTGALLPPPGALPELGNRGLLAGERLLIDPQGRLVSVTLGSIKGDAQQMGDTMAFTNLPAAITVDGKAFARLAGAVARLAGANLAQGLEVAPSGVFMLRDGGQIFQLLPTQPITVDAKQPDGLSFTPLGLLRWVRGGVVVQFAPAVADLAGLASAVTTALPGATLQLGAEGVLQLGFGGTTYVLKPDWTGAGVSTATPRVGVDEQGRIVFQAGNGPGQLLLPALLSATQAQGIFGTAIPGATLAVQPGSGEGALTLTLGGQTWRLLPQWALPAGAAGQTEPWRMGADGMLYLKLGTQVQGMRIAD